MRWVLSALGGLILLQLFWGAFSRIGSPLYWSLSVGLFVAVWAFWIWRWVRPLNFAHDGSEGIGYCITLILVTIAEAVGLVAAYRGGHPPVDAIVLFLLINLLGSIGLFWIGWAKRKSKGEGYVFQSSTVTFARGTLPLAIFIPCVFVAMAFAHALPLGAVDGPEFLLATSYLTKSASMNNPSGVVGVGAAKEGMQVLLSVDPHDFPDGWPNLIAIDIRFDHAFQSEWRISGASHAFVGGRKTLVDLLVVESSERQRMADVQWMTHHGFLKGELAQYLVGLNADGTREDLRNLAPIEILSPEEPSGVETVLLREVPEGPFVIQLVLERRSQESPASEIGQSLRNVTNGGALRYSYR